MDKPYVFLIVFAFFFLLALNYGVSDNKKGIIIAKESIPPYAGTFSDGTQMYFYGLDRVKVLTAGGMKWVSVDSCEYANVHVLDSYRLKYPFHFYN